MERIQRLQMILMVDKHDFSTQNWVDEYERIWK